MRRASGVHCAPSTLAALLQRLFLVLNRDSTRRPIWT